MRKVVPLKKSAVHPGEPDLLASRAAVRAGRNEENWFPRKKVQCIPASLISWLPGRRSPGRNEEKWFRRERVRRLSAALTSWFPGRGSEPRGMSKSGSCKENVLGSFFVAELEGSRRARHRGGFRERPKS